MQTAAHMQSCRYSMAADTMGYETKCARQDMHSYKPAKRYTLIGSTSLHYMQGLNKGQPC
jgi:hypothetical protein